VLQGRANRKSYGWRPRLLAYEHWGGEGGQPFRNPSGDREGIGRERESSDA
jgi:hypothetical protein